MPPSTPPIPPGSGRVLPSCPMKYGHDDHRLGGASPNAWKHDHSTAMSNPHHATAPSRYGSRVRTSEIAVRMPRGGRRRRQRERAGEADRGAPSPSVPRATRRSKSPGSSDTTRNTAITTAPKIAGIDRDGERRRSGKDPEVEAEAADHQRGHVDAVQQRHEGDHPAGDDAPLHSRPPQRPRRQRDAAGAGGREQPRRGQARHRDLVALAPVDPRLSAHEHGAEQHDVARQTSRTRAARRARATRRSRSGSGSTSPAGQAASAARSTGTRPSRRRTRSRAAPAGASAGCAASPPGSRSAPAAVRSSPIACPLTGDPAGCVLDGRRRPRAGLSSGARLERLRPRRESAPDQGLRRAARPRRTVSARGAPAIRSIA